MFEIFEEERDLPLQLSTMNDLEVWVRIRVDEDGSYNIDSFGFQDDEFKILWIDTLLWNKVLPRKARKQIREKIRIHAQDDPAVDPQKEEMQ